MPPPTPKKPGSLEQTYLDIVKAKFAYTPSNPDELEFKADDVLYVLNKDDPNWWKCRSEDREGLVPANYITENTSTLDNPLHEAAKRGNMEFVQELLLNNISVNGLDKAKNTPLHWAARGGHVEVVKALLTRPNIAINAQNKLGDSPLHSAAWGGSEPAVALLLSHAGIDSRLKNRNGSTPADLARNDAVASLLLQYSALSDNVAQHQNHHDIDDNSDDDEDH